MSHREGDANTPDFRTRSKIAPLAVYIAYSYVERPTIVRRKLGVITQLWREVLGVSGRLNRSLSATDQTRRDDVVEGNAFLQLTPLGHRLLGRFSEFQAESLLSSVCG